MRLISCHIDNFGKLQDLDILFDTGQSVIYEENGWGKSTLAAFLKVMFFGFDNEGKHDSLLNERKRYQPWQKGIYGGRVVFEAEGTVYRLERVFDEKRSGNDTTELYDQETNRLYDISVGPVTDGNLGEALFGIDGRSFQRTVLIRQQDCADSAATAEISAKIGRVSDQVADLGNYETVRVNLEKEQNRLTPKRKTGQISRLKTEAAELKETVREKDGLLRTLEQAEREKEKLKTLRLEEQAAKEMINSEIRMFGEKQERRILAEQYRNLLKAEEDAKELVRWEKHGFSSQPPSVAEIDDSIEQTRHCKKLRASSESLREQAEMIRTVTSDRQEEEQKDPLFFNLFLVAGLFLLILGIILAITENLMTGLLLSVTGVASSSLWWYLKQRERPLISGSSVEVDGYKAAEVRYERLMKEISEKEAEVQKIERKTRRFLAEYTKNKDPASFSDPETSLQELKSRVRSFQVLWEEYQKKKGERESFEEIHDPVELEEELRNSATRVPGENDADLLQEITTRLNQKQSDIETISAKIKDQDRQMERVIHRLEEIGQAEADLEEKQHEITLLQHRYDIISKTKEYLEEAKIRFSSRYMNTVRTSFDRYYHMIAGNDGEDYEMDADFNIRVREAGSLHDTELLSGGSRDLIGLCRRMALIDAMYEKEKPFLIFDDPFVNLDDRRLAGALRFLDLISEEYQVIYFSCSEARVPAG